MTSTKNKTCKYEDCNKPEFSRGTCSQHYFQERRDPEIQRAEAEDFWLFVKKELGL